MKYLYSTILLLFITFNSFAQAPELMSYQALVRDSNDQLIQNTSVGVRISILQGSETGTAVYTETHTETTNDNGLVTLAIGSGSTTDDFSSIDWGNGTYYIKSETDPNGGSNYTIEGTSQLLSVPYALYAENVANTTNSNTPNTSTLNNNLNTSFAFEALEDNIVYAWSPSYGWVGQNYNEQFNGAGAIVASNGNFAFEALEDNIVYAWSFITGQWSAQSYNEQFNGAGEIIASNGNFAFEALEDNIIYVWSSETGQWSAQSYNEQFNGAGEIIASNGNFAFEALEDNIIYIWNPFNGQWNGQSYNEQFNGAGTIVVSPQN